MTSKRLKIVYINHTNHVSGAEVSLSTLLTSLDRQSYEAFLIMPNGGEWAARFGNLDTSVFAIHNGENQFFKKPSKTNLPFFIIKFLLLIWQIRVILNKIQPNIIHANSIRAGLVAVLATASLRRNAPKVLVHVRDVPDKSAWLQRLTIWCLSLLAFRLICISNFIGQSLWEHFPSWLRPRVKAKTTVIYNGVDLAQAQKVLSALTKAEARTKIAQQFNIELHNEPLLGVIGQLTPWKGQLDLLKAFHQFIETAPTCYKQTRLLIVGDAKFTDSSARYNTQLYKQELKDFVVAHNLISNVIFAGEQLNVLEIMRGLDIVVVPSWHEPFGRVVIEAMSVNTPVIGTCAGGIPEILTHGETGWLVEPANPSATAYAIQALIKDKALLEQLAQKGRLEIEKRFEIKRIARQLDSMYQAVVNNPPLAGAGSQFIRILYVNHTGQISGAEISLLRTLQSLDKSIFQPYLACPAASPLWQAASRIEQLHLLDLTPFTFGYRLNLATLRAIFVASCQLFRLEVSIRPKIVHANSIRAGLICGLVRLIIGLRLFRASPKLFIHLRDSMDVTLVNKVIVAFLRLTSFKLLAISDYIARHNRALLRWPSKPEQYIVVHDGVNINEFDPSKINSDSVAHFRSKLGLSEDSFPVIGVVGQMTPWKGHRDAIEAMPRILQQFPNAKLLMVGSPKFTQKTTRYDMQAYYNELKELAKTLDIADKVIFTGELQEMPLLMASLDVFLLCSWSEPFGLVYIEAMAMERPVVATIYGGPEEIVVEGVTGLKVKPCNPEAIAAAVLKLASDQDSALVMGKKGRERVLQLFTDIKQALQLAQLYTI